MGLRDDRGASPVERPCRLTYEMWERSIIVLGLIRPPGGAKAAKDCGIVVSDA